jgi:hypothetical protein
MNAVLWCEDSPLKPHVSDRDYKRFLRFPVRRVLEGPLAENARWARAWFAEHARPWTAAVRVPAEVRGLVGDRFAAETDLAIVIVSAGLEAEAEAAARWQEEEPDRYFFLESYAAAVVEALLADARNRLGADRHLCPGYPGWPITDNLRLLDTLRRAGVLPDWLTALDSGMLSPKKSQLAVCAVRKIPRHESMNTSTPNGAMQANVATPVIDAAYSFPERALRRWVKENLTTESRADGGLDAVFRFEGSTCGNVDFVLLYHVALAADHSLEALRCEPAPFYEGHERMCCWQDDAEAVAVIMRQEAPLLGQPLAAVLTWRPRKSPAGCLCTEQARHHKWQAVLETLHRSLHPPAENSLL